MKQVSWRHGKLSSDRRYPHKSEERERERERERDLLHSSEDTRVNLESFHHHLYLQELCISDVSMHIIIYVHNHYVCMCVCV